MRFFRILCAVCVFVLFLCWKVPRISAQISATPAGILSISNDEFSLRSINLLKMLLNGNLLGGLNNASNATTAAQALQYAPLIPNQYSGSATGSSAISGVVSGLLPNPLPPLTSNAASHKQEIISTCLPNKAIYQQAEQETGVPWQLLAGIHMVEGGCHAHQSLISGRAIGAVEPDIGNACSALDNGPGKPYPISGGGCGFRTLVDSAIDAGRILKGKLLGKVPSTMAEAVLALARYNGEGNANCGSTPFPYCPPQFHLPFRDWDHIHPMNYFDEYHERMYVVYCADGKKCQDMGINPPVYRVPGAMTVMRILVEGGY